MLDELFKVANYKLRKFLLTYFTRSAIAAASNRVRTACPPWAESAFHSRKLATGRVRPTGGLSELKCETSSWSKKDLSRGADAKKNDARTGEYVFHHILSPEMAGRSSRKKI